MKTSILRDHCRYDFVPNYDYCGTDSRTGKRQYHKVTKPRLPNHRFFERRPERRPLPFSDTLLFVPFRDESSLLLENETAEEAFLQVLPADSHCSAYHCRLQKVLQPQANINHARQADGEEHRISKDDEPQLMGEARAAMKELFDMNTNQPDTLSSGQRVAMVNTDHRHVFDKVKAHFLHQKEHEAMCLQLDTTLNVSGVGGTGKSFLVEIKSLVSKLWPTDDLHLPSRHS